ncbi:hypothetical protein [Paralimibaculum aggregatum]|uniref:hypothetical protein n=1 Tax=Paralimibaculum aggregatum TaxID=3036245 RepID=UPI0025542AB4|nr:hypothetical protein [Limibaculum sp. NKW23]
MSLFETLGDPFGFGVMAAAAAVLPALFCAPRMLRRRGAEGRLTRAAVLRWGARGMLRVGLGLWAVILALLLLGHGGRVPGEAAPPGLVLPLWLAMPLSILVTLAGAALIGAMGAQTGWFCAFGRRPAAMLGLVLLAALPLAPAPARAAEPAAAFAAWIAGDWADPRLHRCGVVWVRIRVEGGRVEHLTVTYGNAVPGASGRILAYEGDGSVRIFNERLGRDQRLRYVTRDAHVLERVDGAGGVTFVRCPEAGDVPLF